MSSTDSPHDLPSADAVDRIRAFNRWYTRRLDVLSTQFLSLPFSLVEARVLWEIANRHRPAAAEIARDLGLDPGQVSRLLQRLEARRLVLRMPSPVDARRSTIGLTEAGRAAYADMDAEQHARIAAGLTGLEPEAIGRLTAAMTDVHRLSDPEAAAGPLVIRPHRAGDVAWACYRQAAFYAEAWGFRGPFAALVMEVGRRFLADFDPRRDASFLADIGGRIVGSAFVTHSDDPGIAKLRLLWVESEMRGRGLGSRLTDEAVRFAREAGYTTLTLWTQDVLVAARRIYARAGFSLVSGEPNSDYGPPVVSEHWELAL